MRSNGVGGRGQSAAVAMQSRQQQQAQQQLRHSEYLEASVAELADNYQAMLWQQRRGKRERERIFITDPDSSKFVGYLGLRYEDF